jgi:hypothetical protein
VIKEVERLAMRGNLLCKKGTKIGIWEMLARLLCSRRMRGTSEAMKRQFSSTKET